MPEIKEQESDINNEPNNAVANTNAGEMMLQLEGIEQKGKNSIFSFSFYNQTKSKMEMEFTYEDFMELDIEECFEELKDCSAMKFLMGIQKRMKATKDPKRINVQQEHQIEYANDNNGASHGFGVIIANTKDGIIYIKFAGINKKQTMKVKWLIKAGGYGLTAVSLGLTGFIAANAWQTERDNTRLREANAQRAHETQLALLEIERAKAQNPVTNYFVTEVVPRCTIM
mmetsp:Transcript_78747/g.96297  ORF Transcript_78747/g.96297 Transcript_78747/m.96297 type:complete len:228 (+) Transcript_78747:52-735(+)